MNSPVEDIQKALDWLGAYRDDLHSYCDIDKYDYADCSCGLDEIFDAALRAAEHLSRCALNNCNGPVPDAET